MNRRSLAKPALLALILSLTICALSTSAQAQVKIEGSTSFRIRYSATQMQTSVHIDRVSNYNYEDYMGARAVLVLSKKAYVAGSGVKGYTVASSASGYLPARTYVDNLNFKGTTRTVKGQFKVLVLIVDGGNRILDGVTFSKKARIGFKSAASATAAAGSVSAAEFVARP